MLVRERVGLDVGVGEGVGVDVVQDAGVCLVVGVGVVKDVCVVVMCVWCCSVVV